MKSKNCNEDTFENFENQLDEDSLEDWGEFQENTWDYGEKIPQFEYLNPEYKSVSRENPILTISLIGLSAIIIILGTAIKKLFFAIIIVVAIWTLIEILSKETEKYLSD